MAIVKFSALGADIEYELNELGKSEHLRINGELNELGKSEHLRINGELITDAFGDVGGWGEDYHDAVDGLSGAAKQSAENLYLRRRAEGLIISELLALREMVEELNREAA